MPAVPAEQMRVIVVAIYIALADDIVSHAIKASIDCKRWSRDYSDGELFNYMIS